jgi:hypothetical protein
LQDHLGRQLAALSVHAADEQTLARIAAGTLQPSDAQVWRMRHAYQAARLLVDAHGDATARSWLLGANPHLDYRAPALVLRDSAEPTGVSAVAGAARAFVAGKFS